MNVSKVVAFCVTLCLVISLFIPAPVSAAKSTTEPDVIVATGVPDVANTYMPDMELLDDGRLVVVYYNSPAHEGAGAGWIMIAESEDYGETWSTPRVLMDNGITEDDRDPSITQLSDGTLILSWFMFNTVTAERKAYVSRSTDGGTTWSSPIVVGTNLASTSAVTSKVVELDNGDLIIPLYGMYESRSDMPVSTMVRSTDGGLTWDASTEVEIASDPDIGYVEPVIVNLGNGHLYSVHRTLRDIDAYHSWESHSYDNGYTWSKPERMETKGHCSDLLLLSNGMLLHTWGDRSFNFGGGRPVVGKAKPADAEWSDYADILIYKNTGVGDMAYPSAVELPDGRIFIVYYDASRAFIGGSYTTVEELSQRVPEHRIDLLSMYNNGELQIDTDMTYTNPSYPNTGITGAIDGGFAYGDASFKAAKAPPDSYYEITFNELMSVTDLGLNLRPGYKVSADVYYSEEGSSWTPIATFDNAVHETGVLEMIDLEAPLTVKKLKVVITYSAEWAGITEIAVFGTPISPGDPGDKIDLLSLYNANKIQIDTDMNVTNTRGTQPSGAIDGDLTYWYSAARDSTAPPLSYFTVDLGETRNVSAIGVNLKPGYAEDAVVSISTDGSTWEPVKTYTDAVHEEGSIDITCLSEAQSARFVKVEVTKSAGHAMLNELELYE